MFVSLPNTLSTVFAALMPAFLRRLPDQPAIIESFWFSSEVLLLLVPIYHFCRIDSRTYDGTAAVLPSSAKNHKE